MGGERYCSSPSSNEHASLSCQYFLHDPITTSISSGDEERLSRLIGDSVMKGVRVSDSGEFPDVGGCKTSIDEAAEKQKLRVCTEILRRYEDLQPRIEQLEVAKNKILREYDVPNATSLLLVGPEGSGKSSLINKIYRVFEDDTSLPARAQISCSSSPGGGTYFLQEYMIPRKSGSFCLYDSRGLSFDSSENVKMIKPWMTKGVRHGEMIRRKSDSPALRAQLKHRARRSFVSSQIRSVDFVIFVVNGVSLLESMNSTDETKKGYSQMIATNFNNPLLSFRDDKPAIVVTHGDLLPVSDRVRIRAYLGELLGVPPTWQIFDIPEDNDPTTTSAIYDLLIYCLDRADRNFPPNDLFLDKVHGVPDLLFWLALPIIAIISFTIPMLHLSQPQAPPISRHLNCSQTQAPPPPPKLPTCQPRAPPPPLVKLPSLHRNQPPPFEVEWHKIRHLWYNPEFM